MPHEEQTPPSVKLETARAFNYIFQGVEKFWHGVIESETHILNSVENMVSLLLSFRAPSLFNEVWLVLSLVVETESSGITQEWNGSEIQRNLASHRATFNKRSEIPLHSRSDILRAVHEMDISIRGIQSSQNRFMAHWTWISGTKCVVLYLLRSGRVNVLRTGVARYQVRGCQNPQ